jgi:hypothetical protein
VAVTILYQLLKVLVAVLSATRVLKVLVLLLHLK